MLVNRRTLRIEWGQCDPAGIVFYPQYLIIFDTSTGWLFERTGLTPSAMRKKYGIVGMPVVEVGARFVIPCHFIVRPSTIDDSGFQGRDANFTRHRHASTALTLILSKSASQVSPSPGARVIQRDGRHARRIGKACDDFSRDRLSFDRAGSLRMGSGPNALLKAVEGKLAIF